MSLHVDMVASWLQATLSTDANERTSATSAVLGFYEDDTFPFVLVDLLLSQRHTLDLQHAAAVTLKNWCRSEWMRFRVSPRVTEFGSRMLAIIQMTSVPEPVFRQVSTTLASMMHRELGGAMDASPWEAIVLAGRRQLTHHWLGRNEAGVYRLLTWLDEIVHTDNAMVVVAVAGCCNETLTDYWLECAQVVQSSGTQAPSHDRLVYLATLTPILVTFIDAGVPVIDGDKRQQWLESMGFLVSCDALQAHGALLVHVCHLVEAYLRRSVDTVPAEWVMKLLPRLCAMVPRTSSDELVTCVLRILDRLVRSPSFQSLFSQESSIRQIFDGVIAPQLRLGADEMETFESDPLEFLKLDLDDSQGAEARRSTSMDLIRTLVDTWQQGMVTLLNDIASGWMNRASEASSRNDIAIAIQFKSAAMYLITAFCSRHQKAQQAQRTRKSKRRGASVGPDTSAAGQLLVALDTSHFLSQHVISELAHMDSRVERAIIKAQCLRFVATFAEHVEVEQRSTVVQLVTGYLFQTEQPILRAYAAHAYQKLLSLSWECIHRPLLAHLLHQMSCSDNDRNLYMSQLVHRAVQLPMEHVDSNAIGAMFGVLKEVMSRAVQGGDPGDLQCMELMCDALQQALSRTSADLAIWSDVLQWVVQLCDGHQPRDGAIDESHIVMHFTACKLLAGVLGRCTHIDLVAQAAMHITNTLLNSPAPWKRASASESRIYCMLLEAVSGVLGVSWADTFLVERVMSWSTHSPATMLQTACDIVTHLSEHSNCSKSTLVRTLSVFGPEHRSSISWKHAAMALTCRMSTTEELASAEHCLGNAIASSTWESLVAAVTHSRTTPVIIERVIRSTLKLLLLANFEQTRWCTLIQQLNAVVGSSRLQPALHRPILQEIRTSLQQTLQSQEKPYYAAWLQGALPADAVLRAVVTGR